MASVLPKTDSPASSSIPSAVASPPPPPSDLDVLDVLVVVFLDLDVDLHCFKESGVFQKLVEI